MIKKYGFSLFFGLLSQPLFAGCPDLSGTYDVTSYVVDNNHETPSHYGTEPRTFSTGEIVLHLKQKGCSDAAFDFVVDHSSNRDEWDFKHFFYNLRFFNGTLITDGSTKNLRVNMNHGSRMVSTESFSEDSLDSALFLQFDDAQGNPDPDMLIPAGKQHTSLGSDGVLRIVSTGLDEGPEAMREQVLAVKRR